MFFFFLLGIMGNWLLFYGIILILKLYLVKRNINLKVVLFSFLIVYYILLKLINGYVFRSFGVFKFVCIYI